MESTQQAVANRFWQDHFPQWINTPLTEIKAVESGFWDTLQDTLESVDEHTAWAVALANPMIQITSPEMHFRIASVAKRESDRKHYQTDESKARRHKEQGRD